MQVTIERGAVLYDIRDPEDRPCCNRGGLAGALTVGASGTVPLPKPTEEVLAPGEQEQNQPREVDLEDGTVLRIEDNTPLPNNVQPIEHAKVVGQSLKLGAAGQRVLHVDLTAGEGSWMATLVLFSQSGRGYAERAISGGETVRVPVFAGVSRTKLLVDGPDWFEWDYLEVVR